MILLHLCSGAIALSSLLMGTASSNVSATIGTQEPVLLHELANESSQLRLPVTFKEDIYPARNDEKKSQALACKYDEGMLVSLMLDGTAYVETGDEILMVSKEQIAITKTDRDELARMKEAEEKEKAAREKAEKEKAAKEKAEKEKAEQEAKEKAKKTETGWTGPRLSASMGVNYGPTGKETYYNLPMDGVVSIMRSMGNQDPYWVREDGVKMLGDYVMVAAHLGNFPRGSYVPTSLGMGIVCDTGGFAASNATQLDIATAW